MNRRQLRILQVFLVQVLADAVLRQRRAWDRVVGPDRGELDQPCSEPLAADRNSALKVDEARSRHALVVWARQLLPEVLYNEAQVGNQFTAQDLVILQLLEQPLQCGRVHVRVLLKLV